MTRGRNIRWQGDDFARYVDRIGQMKNNFTGDLYETLNEVGVESVRKMKERVANSGTMTNPSGRYETWAMHNAISHETVTTPRGGVVRFGWVGNAPNYTLFQERGTLSLEGKEGVDPFNKPGPGIPGMFALLDTFIEARESLRDRGITGDNG